MEYYYKPLNQAYDCNSIKALIGVDPEVMDEETLLQHHLYPVLDQDRDPFLFSSGEYAYEVKDSKALRFVVDVPIELREAKRIAKLMLLRFLNDDFERIASNSGLTTQCLLALSLTNNAKIKDLFHDQLAPVLSFFEGVANAIAEVNEADDFTSVKQIVTSACKRN